MEHQSSPPHVLIFPLPIQGHMTPMLNLAELLCLAKVKVTFLTTTYNHQRLTRYTDVEARFGRYPGLFEFKTVSDGLPEDHPRGTDNKVNEWLKMLIQVLASRDNPLIKEIMSATNNEFTCMILDGWLYFVNEVATEANLPVISFQCCGACSVWTYFCIPMLVEAGEIPFKDNEEMDELVKNAPGMESFLRYRDLNSFCRGQDLSSCQSLKTSMAGGTRQTQQAHSLILNTFEDLEGPILTHIRSKIPKVYSIGPLHAHLKSRLGPEKTTLLHANNSSTSTSLWEVDQSCISWLDQKPDKSVVYVSFGSTTVLTRDQFKELWAGLVQSQKFFLWVIRSNFIEGCPTQDELFPEGTEERGYMAEWVQQEEVLTHRAVGGFLTHSGWNSILESIVAGVPMLCWPYFADHQVNSRFVSEVWKIGLDMKDTCDRTIVAKMINDLMDEKKDELQREMNKISHLAKKSISELGGTSYSNLNYLIDEIRSISSKK